MSDIDSTLAYNESVEDSIRFGQVDVLDENDGVWFDKVLDFRGTPKVEVSWERRYCPTGVFWDEIGPSEEGIDWGFCWPENMVVRGKAITRDTINGAHLMIGVFAHLVNDVINKIIGVLVTQQYSARLRIHAHL